MGVGKASGKSSSTTTAGISGIAGNKDARTGDAETGIARIFDQAKVQKEIQAQTQITQTFGQLATKAVGDHAQGQIDQAGLVHVRSGDPGADSPRPSARAGASLR